VAVAMEVVGGVDVIGMVVTGAPNVPGAATNPSQPPAGCTCV